MDTTTDDEHFEDGTKVMRAWLAGQDVEATELVVELRHWLGYFGGEGEAARLRAVASAVRDSIKPGYPVGTTLAASFHRDLSAALDD